MKRAIILLLVFVFVTLLTSSCVAGLRRDNYYHGYNDNYQGYNYGGYNDIYRGYNYNYGGYNDNYRNNPIYQYNDNRGNYNRRGKLLRNRYERNNRNDRRTREGRNTLIIH